MTTENPWNKIATDLADLVAEKNKAYGSSFEKAGAIMRILYPDGIAPEKLDDALTVVRVLDKLFRIATDRDALGESPWRDVLGYALLAVERQERGKVTKATPPAVVDPVAFDRDRLWSKKKVPNPPGRFVEGKDYAWESDGCHERRFTAVTTGTFTTPPIAYGITLAGDRIGQTYIIDGVGAVYALE